MASAAIEVRTRLRPVQSRIYLNPARFRVVVAGRRGGKTFLAKTLAVQAALGGPNRLVWYVAPTYGMAREIFWTELKRYVPMAALLRKPLEQAMEMHFHNGSIIRLKGADDPDRLRGVGVDFIILDEYAFMKAGVWENVLEGTLADKMGRALFIGTPCGYNHFYDLYMLALNGNDPTWSAHQYTSIDGGNILPGEIERLRRTVAPKIFRQEYEASFETLLGRVYYSFDRTINHVPGLRDAGGTVLVGMDFNVNPMTAVLAQKAGQQCQVFGEIYLPNSNTFEMSQVLRQRFPNRQVLIYPDASGDARKTSAVAGQSDHQILRDTGFTVIAPAQNPFVQDRINSVNALLCNAAGERNLLINAAECKNLVKTLDGLTYKEGTNLPDKSTGLDHIGDGLGYLVMGEWPIFSGSAEMESIL